MEPKTDFPEHFGTYPQKCVPSVYWNFMNPAISLSNGKVIHVVEIPKSWNAPHSLGSNETGWQFAKRTNKGNEGMSYEEIRLYFLGYYEKRLKLQLMRAELGNIIDIAKSYDNPGLPLYTFELNVLNSVLADTYSIIANTPNLLALLIKIRNSCNAANNRTQHYYGIDVPYAYGRYEQKKALEAMESNHKNYMLSVSRELVPLCSDALKMLDEILIT